MSFDLVARSGQARAGVLHTAHGPVETPVFVPVGTRATVRGLMPRQLEEAGAQMLLANAYHLFLRPGEEVIRDLGGLHGFAG
ncbi:MAG: tRNA-guanine transglycosylase, partial [Planctomycetota bacterium]